MRTASSERTASELLARLSPRELPTTSRRELLLSSGGADSIAYRGDKHRRRGNASDRRSPRSCARACLCGAVLLLTCCCAAVAIVLLPLAPYASELYDVLGNAHAIGLTMDALCAAASPAQSPTAARARAEPTTARAR